MSAVRGKADIATASCGLTVTGDSSTGFIAECFAISMDEMPLLAYASPSIKTRAAPSPTCPTGKVVPARGCGHSATKGRAQPSSMEGFFMAKVTWHGWSTSEDEIPEPNSIITGANLRKPPARPESERERVLASIAEWIAAQEKSE
jgi:hypothetical protein